MKKFDAFKQGTPLCGMLGACAGIVLAVLLLTIGLWKTLFIAVFAALGAFLGGVKDHAAFVKSEINKQFPERKDVPVKPADLPEEFVKSAEEAQKTKHND